METLDGLIPEEMQSENCQQLLDISALKMLYVDNPLKRKMPNANLAYAWLALAIVEKHKLQTPLWVVTVFRREAVRSIRSPGIQGVSIAAAKSRQAETDKRILLAISDYQKAIVKPITVHMVQEHKPTVKEFEEAARKIRQDMHREMDKLEKIKNRNPEQVARLAVLQDQLQPVIDEKGFIAKRIAKKHRISQDVLMKYYYQVSPPKKKGAKKQPSFSLSTWLPAPFSDLPF